MKYYWIIIVICNISWLGIILNAVAGDEPQKKVLVTEHLPPLPELLESVGLSKYYDIFVNKGIDETQYVMKMKDNDMRVMGMKKDEMDVLKGKIEELKIEKVVLPPPKVDILMKLRDQQEYGRLYVDRSVQSFEYLPAFFGAPMPLEPGRLIVADPWDSCSPQSSLVDIAGAFLLVGRGNCSFLEKVNNISIGVVPRAMIVVSNNETIIRPASVHAVGVPEVQALVETGIVIPENLSVVMVKGSAMLPILKGLEVEGLKGRLVPLQCSAGKSYCPPVLEEEKKLIPQIDAGYLRLEPSKEVVEFMTSTFGGVLPSGPMEAMFASPVDGCSELENASMMPGKIAVLMRGGGCGFGEKTERVQNASARAAIIIDSTDAALQKIAATPEITKRLFIPAMLVTSIGGAALQKQANDDSKIMLTINAEQEIAFRWTELAVLEWPSEPNTQAMFYYSLLQKNKASKEREAWISKKYAEHSKKLTGQNLNEEL